MAIEITTCTQMDLEVVLKDAPARPLTLAAFVTPSSVLGTTRRWTLLMGSSSGGSPVHVLNTTHEFTCDKRTNSEAWS